MSTGSAEMLFRSGERGCLQVTIGNESGNFEAHLLKFQATSAFKQRVCPSKHLLCLLWKKKKSSKLLHLV